ncbi:MAG: adenosylcobinamide-GDP ribazoletransferase [Rhodospirillaceae bacterium]|nr:adenosylcobinamide-GDP ribazoletransferase [Rhodospirillaceae bacterium]MBT4941072.1 adenosylcobinamide-GDP ribazoletransferase [Rhodospirillaceae bacterium]MBT5940652.1 adenosylcobinamide-GDP ribazoletransferase [Rhodospirillaceae bacterium]MBT7265358.1 adenosylcobinamide-GDP ribazoletransferase [Rhodospirillaceae bacterium]
MADKEDDVKKDIDEPSGEDQEDSSQEEELSEESDFLDRIKYKVNKQGWFADLKICLGVLTRLPVYIGASPEDFSISEASRLFPIVGAIVGLIAGSVLWIGSWFDFPSAILALLALLAMTLVTGALHEDGLADTCDGLGGGITREQKLSIMRDSQIGSYGVMALLFSFGLRWAALTEITEVGVDAVLLALVAAAAASRAALPAIMHYIPLAREDGLSAGAGKPSFDRAITALLIGIAFLLFLLGFRTSIVALGLAVLAAGLFVYFVATRLGGQTGDVLGATQQITETTILLAILMVGLE